MRYIEDDYEGKMAKAQLKKIESYAKKLNEMIMEEDELEAWVQAKLSVVAAYMGDVKHYLDYELEKAGQSIEKDETDEILEENNEEISYTAPFGFEEERQEEFKKGGTIKVGDKVRSKQFKGVEGEVISKKGEMLFIRKKGENNDSYDVLYLDDVEKMADGGSIYKVEPSSMSDDMQEAKEIVGSRWVTMSMKEKIAKTKELRASGMIGHMGEQEDLETISAMQYYAKGGYAKGGVLANGKYSYEKGDEGMYEGDEVRVVKYEIGSEMYIYDILNDGKVSGHNVAKKNKFESQFAYFPKMAKGGNVRMIKEADKYKHGWGRTNEAVGEFDIVISENGKRRVWYGTLYDLDDFDKDYFKVKLKPDEKLFRYSNYSTEISKIRPVVKINTERGIIYFLEDLYSDDDKNLKFETRGTKLKYLTLLDK